MNGYSSGSDIWSSVVAAPGVTDRRPVPTFKFSDGAVTALDAAFRNCLQEMIANPLERGTLSAIEALAAQARQTLAIVKKDDPAHDLAHAEAVVGEVSGAVVGGVTTLAPAPRAETFGASIVREVVGLAKSIHSDPMKMVQAVAAARTAGMDDLADALEAEVRARFAASTDKAGEGGKVVKLERGRRKRAR